MGFHTKNHWEFSGHLFGHARFAYLPESYLRSEKFRTNDQRDTMVDYAKERCRRASFNFIKVLLDMAKTRNGIGFRPVLVKVGTEIKESPHSDFFRCMSLFESCFETEESHFDMGSRYFRILRQRIIDFGKSEAVLPHHFRSNPFLLPAEHQHQEIVICHFFLKEPLKEPLEEP